MRLTNFRIKNFRGYLDGSIGISDLTTIVGANDAGKSTIFEALDIFFGNSKIEDSDWNVFNKGCPVELVATFTELPKTVTIESVETSLQDEFLLNSKGELEIMKRFEGVSSAKTKEFLIAEFPIDERVADIHRKKISDLRKDYADIVVNADKRKSSEIRCEVLKKFSTDLELTEIPLDASGDLKNISREIHNQLPIFQLFKTDRDNSDNDSEIQDPIKAIVNSALSDSDTVNELNTVVSDIQKKVKHVTDRTLEKIKEMNPELADALIADFSEPRWASLFKFNLETEDNIPLNKRGSGIRRLVLLNFFRAEAERQSETGDNVGIIYAFEEPETAQHPKHQRILIESFKKMSESNNVQVLITTHSPSISSSVPAEGIRLVGKNHTILSGDIAVGQVIEELGIFPNLKFYPDQIKKVVFVEGTTDVEFFQNIFNQLALNGSYEDQRIIFVPSGGAQIKDIVLTNFIRQLNVAKKYAIVDGDDSGSEYKTKMKGCTTLVLNQNTVEFYLPFEDVKENLKGSQCELKSSKEEWNLGKDSNKLSKSQKRKIKDSDLFGNVNIDNMEEDLVEELRQIVWKIEN